MTGHYDCSSMIFCALIIRKQIDVFCKFILVKMAVWESQLMKYAEPLAKASKGLSSGKVPLKRKKVLMQTGTLLTLRYVK